MKVSLSGFAGVGKSTIIEYIEKHYPHVFISPESAREVNDSKDFFLINDENKDFFQKSVMDNEIMKISLCHLNSIENVVFDRSLVDNLAFAEIFYGKDRINYVEIQNYIDNSLQRYQTNYMYDVILFIKSTQNKDFINEKILNDPFRRATTSNNADDFIEKSKQWEKIYFGILKKLQGVAPKVIKLPHFTDIKNHEKELSNLLKRMF